VNLREAEELLLDLELFGMRFGLDRMHRLTTALGMPQRRFASVHVVGTNGKSSTARMTAAILERHGLRTGTFTSPHLGSFAERVEVGERPLAGADFAAAIARAWRAAQLVERTLPDGERITQFELLTAAAFHELARRGVEAAVVEAGLGGRYDATNVIQSKVQVLTSVGLDHVRWLGPTLRDVAEEKLDVVTAHGTLVVPAELPAEAAEVVERVARERAARVVVVPGEEGGLPLRARGRFQRRNFALAAAAAEAFLGRPIERRALRAAAAEVEVRGRLQVVAERPLTVLDAAHNPDGARALAESLPEVVAGRPLTAVLSVLEDKDAAGIVAAIVPLCERLVLTRCRNPRALPPATLASLAEKAGARATEIVPDPLAALERARALAGEGGAVVAAGSIYLLADLLAERPAARASTL
jgi:dihydrofolate synthase / folylpolyglutamate synthase